MFSLESSNNSIQFIGFGFVLTSVSRSMPLIYQSDTSLIIEIDIRTEYSSGIIFFDFDFNTNQYFLARLVEPSSIEISYTVNILFV